MSTGPLFPPLGVTGPLPLVSTATGAGREGLFANRNFLYFWLRQALAQLGERTFQVALMWWAIQVTGSLTLTSFVLIATTLPTALLGPLAGVLADRWDRKRLMAVTDLGRALVVAGTCALLVTHQLTFPAAVAASTLLAILGAFFMPASMATLPSLVAAEDLLRANSLVETTLQGAGILGPALGGMLVALVGTAGAFGFNTGCYLVSCGLILAIAFPTHPAAGSREPFAQSLKAGFRLLVTQPTIGGLLVSFACLNFFSVPLLLFLPYFANSLFKVGAQGLGLMEASIACGMMLAALVWARVGQVERRFPVIAGAIAAVPPLYWLMGLVPHFPLFLVALAGLGALFASINVVSMSFFQARVPTNEMGRFMGVLTSLVFGLMPVSYGIFGLVAAAVDPLKLLLLNGGAIAVVAGLVWLVPGLRAE